MKKKYYLSSSEYYSLEIPIEIEPLEGFYFNGRFVLPVKTPPLKKEKLVTNYHEIKYDIIDVLYCICRNTDTFWVPRYDTLNYKGIDECDNKLKNLKVPVAVHVLLLIDKNKKIETWNDFYHHAWASIYDNYEDAKIHTSI